MCFNSRFRIFPNEGTLNVNINANTPTVQPEPEAETVTALNVMDNQVLEERRFRSQSGVVREVHLIHRLQKEAEERLNTLNCGNRNELGIFPRTPYNTRPFILYLPNGNEYSIRITDPITSRANIIGSNTLTNVNPSNSERSSIFRVEKVRGNTAIIRALKVVLDKYIATCSCATVDLTDFVGIQTLNDTFVTNPFC